MKPTAHLILFVVTVFVTIVIIYVFVVMSTVTTKIFKKIQPTAMLL